MTPTDPRMARIYADELSHALSAQITMGRLGVTADFRAVLTATNEAEQALRRLADQFGLKLVPLDADRAASSHQIAAE